MCTLWGVSDLAAALGSVQWKLYATLQAKKNKRRKKKVKTFYFCVYFVYDDFTDFKCMQSFFCVCVCVWLNQSEMQGVWFLQCIILYNHGLTSWVSSACPGDICPNQKFLGPTQKTVLDVASRTRLIHPTERMISSINQTFRAPVNTTIHTNQVYPQLLLNLAFGKNQTDQYYFFWLSWFPYSSAGGTLCLQTQNNEKNQRT